MTGYASILAPAGDAAVSVELRTVNGRFLDLAFKLPDEWRSSEPALRELLTASLRRGKVELRAAMQGVAPAAVALPSAGLLERLAQADDLVRARLHDARPLSVQEVLHWARADATGAPVTGLEAALMQAAREGVAQLRAARAREGAKLAQMLRTCIEDLRALAERARPLVPEAVQRQRERFLQRWHEALEATRVTGAPQDASTQAALAAQERALSEAAAYAIRIDVAEELSRLEAHLSEVERLLHSGGELGKRLDFLVQELHREANTLGSKSTSLALTAISVEMKVLIEQMREQVQNLE